MDGVINIQGVLALIVGFIIQKRKEDKNKLNHKGSDIVVKKRKI